MYTKRRVPPSEIRAGAKLAINKFQHRSPEAIYGTQWTQISTILMSPAQLGVNICIAWSGRRSREVFSRFDNSQFTLDLSSRVGGVLKKSPYRFLLYCTISFNSAVTRHGCLPNTEMSQSSRRLSWTCRNKFPRQTCMRNFSWPPAVDCRKISPCHGHFGRLPKPNFGSSVTGHDAC